MSHDSLTAIWSQLEKRTDVATTLRDALGQYTALCAACDDRPFAVESLQAFNRLINILQVAFHLQRIYLQPRQLSNSIRIYLLDPDIVEELLLAVLAIKNKFVSDGDTELAVRESALKSVGAIVLAGLRLLVLWKAKVAFERQPDWSSKAKLLRSKIADWPLDSSMQRFLVGEVFLIFLDGLETSSDSYPSRNANSPCSNHETYPSFASGLDLRPFEDGLRLDVEPSIVRDATRCMELDCPFWFQSFCNWYDLWSALLAASIELYSRTKRETHPTLLAAGQATNSQAVGLVDSLVDLYGHFVRESVNSGSVRNRRRYGVTMETLFALHPFPKCPISTCSCFGRGLQQHPHQDFQFPGIWQPKSRAIIELQLEIARDLENRKKTLQDADGLVNGIVEKLQTSIKHWTDFPEENTLDLGQVQTYVVNCPELHPLTSVSLGKVFRYRGQEHAIKEIQDAAPQIWVNGIPCPWCEKLPNHEKVPDQQTKSIAFTQARLVNPLKLVDKELKAASNLRQNSEVTGMSPKPYIDRHRRISATSESLHSQDSTSSRKLLKSIKGVMSHHSRNGSSDDTSQKSSKVKSTSKPKSRSSTPSVHIRYAMFTDSKFVLVFTLTNISCYDFDLTSWSRGHSFPKILMAAGSSGRYAVLSQENDACKLYIFRRNSILEGKEWCRILKDSPLSLAVSSNGAKVALGYFDYIHIFDARTGTCSAPLGPAMTENDRKNSSGEKHQVMSFSASGKELVVATRETGGCMVFTGIYDLRPEQPVGKGMEPFKLSSNYGRDLGLSSISCEPHTGTICICSSTAQGETQLINSRTNTGTTITDSTFKPFPGNQIQCAVVIPGKEPRIAMVNDSNKVFILRYRNKRWEPYRVNIKWDSARQEVTTAGEKMSIAAVDNQVRLFWVQKQEQEGRLLTIDPDEAYDGHKFVPEPVLNYAAVLGPG